MFSSEAAHVGVVEVAHKYSSVISRIVKLTGLAVLIACEIALPVAQVLSYFSCAVRHIFREENSSFICGMSITVSELWYILNCANQHLLNN